MDDIIFRALLIFMAIQLTFISIDLRQILEVLQNATCSFPPSLSFNPRHALW